MLGAALPLPSARFFACAASMRSSCVGFFRGKRGCDGFAAAAFGPALRVRAWLLRFDASALGAAADLVGRGSGVAMLRA